MRLGGVCHLKINGENIYATEGEFTFSLGLPKRTAEKSGDRTIGYTTEAQTPYIEGEIFVPGGLDVATIVSADDVIITLELENQTIFRLSNAWYSGEGQQTSKGRLKVRWEGVKASIDR
jgi:hypothetical protein